MPADSLAVKVRRRSLGVTFIVLVAALIGLSIAIYDKAFVSTVSVTLKTDSTGNQLQPDSDVKIRGLIVGSVDSIDSNGSVATVHLDLEPDKVDLIPSNVTAQILPKTLFGEQYVALSAPADPAPHIKAGDIISQDRSKGALEAQTVLSDLYPLLEALHPAQLNETLTALATALNNRGDELGQTIVNADRYLAILNGPSGLGSNTYTEQIAADLDQLGKVAQEYNGVAPDLLSSLKNLVTSAQTVVAKQQQLTALLTGGTTAAMTLQTFLAENQDRIIAVSGQTQQVFTLLDEYSPEFSCLFSGINTLYLKAQTAISDGSIHLTARPDLEKSNPTGNFGPYKNGEQPHLVTGYGPGCFGLPNNPSPLDSSGNFQIPAKYICLNDGAWLTVQGANGQCGTAKTASAKSTSSASDDPLVGTPAEDAMINTLIAGQLGTTPDKVPGTATLLAGPLLRGQKVTVK